MIAGNRKPSASRSCTTRACEFQRSCELNESIGRIPALLLRAERPPKWTQSGWPSPLHTALAVRTSCTPRVARVDPRAICAPRARWAGVRPRDGERATHACVRKHVPALQTFHPRQSRLGSMTTAPTALCVALSSHTTVPVMFVGQFLYRLVRAEAARTFDSSCEKERKKEERSTLY
jgi:hypothetical protein